MHKYTTSETIVANAPYAAMILLGSGTIGFGFGITPWALAGAAAYFVYGVDGAFWIMVFVCPYCAYYATRGCPCGSGMISSRLVRKGDRDCFAEKFKRHIPVVAPFHVWPYASRRGYPKRPPVRIILREPSQRCAVLFAHRRRAGVGQRERYRDGSGYSPRRKNLLP